MTKMYILKVELQCETMSVKVKYWFRNVQKVGLFAIVHPHCLRDETQVMNCLKSVNECLVKQIVLHQLFPKHFSFKL